jgi:hypothetical protein
MSIAAVSVFRGGTGRETRSVEPEVYCQLITSRRQLIRDDDLERGERGLYDPESRIRFVVEEDRLWEVSTHTQA